MLLTSSPTHLMPSLCSLVKVTLPNKATGLTDAAQEKFEQLLIDHGLLKTGVLAASDEISRSLNEDAVTAAQSVRQTTTKYEHP